MPPDPQDMPGESGDLTWPKPGFNAHLTYCLAYDNGGWVPGISKGLHCGQPAPRWTTPLLANPRNPAMSPPCPGTHHTDLVSGEKKISK